MTDTPVYDEEPSEDALKKLRSMALAMAKLTIEESDLQAKLKETQARLGEYANKLVPDLMTESGVDEITAGGFRIAVKDHFRCSFPEDPAAQGVVSRWITDRGEGGALHKKITIEFSSSLASADQVAEIIEASLPAGQADFRYEATIHHSTLGRIVREARVAGQEVPSKELSLFHQRQATIKVAK